MNEKKLIVVWENKNKIKIFLNGSFFFQKYEI